MRTRQHPICTDGGRFRGYGWPATLELLKPVGTTIHRHFRMAICPSCLTVHEIGGKCPQGH